MRARRITELADPREARNPTPGEPNPRIAEAEAALAEATARQQALYAQTQASRVGNGPITDREGMRRVDAAEHGSTAGPRGA